MTIKQYIRIALATSLIALFSLIKFPLMLVPMTLQIFIIVLLAFTIKKLAFYATLLYLIMGLIGFPIFASGGGITYVFVPSFGYLIGMLLMSFLISKYQTTNFKQNIILAILSLFVVYLIGMSYFYILELYYFQQSFDFLWIIQYLFLIFLPNDLISIVVAVIVAKRLNYQV